jgi:hypothetical protein
VNLPAHVQLSSFARSGESGLCIASGAGYPFAGMTDDRVAMKRAVRRCPFEHHATSGTTCIPARHFYDGHSPMVLPGFRLWMQTGLPSGSQTKAIQQTGVSNGSM